jgi:hypothetical protein
MGFPLSNAEGTSWYVFVISIPLCVEGGEQSGTGRSKATRQWPRTDPEVQPTSSFRLRYLSFFLSLMAHSRLGIRPFVPTDLNEVRFTISKSIMEPLTEANKRSAYLGVQLTFKF